MFTILLALMDVECQLLIIILPNTDEKSRFYDIFLDRKRKLVYGFSEAVHLALKPHQHIHAYGYRKSEIAHLKYKVFHLFLLSGSIQMQSRLQASYLNMARYAGKGKKEKMKAVLERKKDRAKGGASKGLNPLKNSA